MDRDEQQVLEQEEQRETGNGRDAQTVDVELKENGKYAAEEGDGNEPSLLSGQFPDDRPVDPKRRPRDGFAPDHQDLMGVDERGDDLRHDGGNGDAADVPVEEPDKDVGKTAVERQSADLRQNGDRPFSGLDEDRGRDAEVQDGQEREREEAQEHGGRGFDLLRGDDLPDVAGRDEVREKDTEQSDGDGNEDHRVDDTLRFMGISGLQGALEHIAGPHGDRDEEPGGEVRIRRDYAVGGDRRVIGKQCQDDVVEQVHEVDKERRHERGDGHQKDPAHDVADPEPAFGQRDFGHAGTGHDNTSFLSRKRYF